MNGSSVCWRTRVGTRTVGRIARALNSAMSGNISATVRGLAARRSSRAHAARISSFHGMSGLTTCWYSPVPHTSTMAASTPPRSGMLDGSALPSSTSSAAVRDGCVAANSAAVGSAPGTARSTASRLSRSSSTAVMLSAHCSNVGSAPGETGSDAPVPGWSKKISRPSDAIASTHP
jgi:hypothetical protein